MSDDNDPKSERKGRGEGGLQQMPDGRWKARFSFVDGNNVRQRPTRYFDTKKAAVAWLSEQRSAHAKGAVAFSGKLTVGQWLDTWLAMKAGRVEPNTHHRYAATIRLHLKPTLGQLQLGRLTMSAVEGMLSQLAEGRGIAGGPVSANEQRRALTTLRTALRVAVKDGKLARNVASDVEAPLAGEGTFDAWDRTEAQQFLMAARGDPYFAYYVVALDSGARQGELFALAWDHVIWDRDSIYIEFSLEDLKSKLRLKRPKNPQSRRTVRLSRATMAALNDHRQQALAAGHYAPDAPVFCSPEGGWLRKGNFLSRFFNRLVARAGVKRIPPNDLRHTSATLALLDGASVKAVAARLGHKDVKQTLNTYARYLPEMDDRIVNTMQGLVSGAVKGPDAPPEAQGTR